MLVALRLNRQHLPVFRADPQHWCVTENTFAAPGLAGAPRGALGTLVAGQAANELGTDHDPALLANAAQKVVKIQWG